MEYTFKVFCVILGLIGTMENGLCINEDEVNEFVEKKLEEVIKKYDRKIALLGKKSVLKTLKFEIWKRNVPLRHWMLGKRKIWRLRHFSSFHQITTMIPTYK